MNIADVGPQCIENTVVRITQVGSRQPAFAFSSDAKMRFQQFIARVGYLVG
jgi:hypothetical protein